MLIQKDQVIIVNGNPSSPDLGTPAAFFDLDLGALQAQSGYHSLREIIIEIDDTGALHGAAGVTSTGTVLNFIALPNPPYGNGRPPRRAVTIAEYLAG
jgi:hypothetical protein